MGRARHQDVAQSDNGGSLKAVRNLAYRTNGRVLKNELGLEWEGYL
jgi:hypothetical protein